MLGLLLPVELVHAIAEYLGDKDLHRLTQVNQRLADIIFPLFFKRADLEVIDRDLTLISRSFSAFPAWSHSPNYQQNITLWAFISPSSPRCLSETSDLCRGLAATPPSTFRNIDIVGHYISKHNAFNLLNCIGYTQVKSALIIGKYDSHFANAKYVDNPNRIYPHLEDVVFEIRGLPLYLSFYIFKSISFPSLHTLTIACNLTLYGLTEFIEKHSGIQSLRLVPDRDVDTALLRKPSFNKITKMSTLFRLEGPLRYIANLLESISTPSLSCLHLHVTARECIAVGSNLEWVTMLAHGVERRPSFIDLELDLDLSILARMYTPSEWYSKIVEDGHCHSFSVAKSLSITVHQMDNVGSRDQWLIVSSFPPLFTLQ